MSYPMVELGEVCEVVSGATPKREVPAYWGGDVDWVTPKDLTDLEGRFIYEAPEKITEAGYKSCSTHMVPAGSVLLSSRAPIGHLAITRRPVCTNQGFKNFISGPKVDAEFLYWALKRDVPKLQAMGTGSTFKEISKAQVEKYKIPLPPLPTQRRIAAILDKSQALVANDRRTLAVYDQLAKSLFLELFGDPVKNERGWEVVTLEDVSAEIIDCPHSTPEFVDGVTEYPCIRTSELGNGYIDWSSMKYLNEEGYVLRTKRMVPQAGDIVYGREGTFGEAAIVLERTMMSLRQRVMLFSPNKKKITSSYFWAALRSDRVYRQALKHTSGSTVGHVNIKDIRKFTLPLPPINMQQRYASALKQVEDHQAKCAASLHRSEGLFGSLLQSAFAGGFGG